jgi:hypothetical protein
VVVWKALQIMQWKAAQTLVRLSLLIADQAEIGYGS